MYGQDAIVDFITDLLKQNHISVRFLTLSDFNETAEPITGQTEPDDVQTRVLRSNQMNHFFTNFIAKLQSNSLYLLRDEFQCSYITLRMPTSDEILFCGPVLYEQLPEEQLTEKISQSNISPQLQISIHDYYAQIPFIGMPSFYLSLFTQLADHLYGAGNYEVLHINSDEFHTGSDYYDEYFHVPDRPFLNVQMIESRYLTESELLAAVESGNEAKALAYLDSFSMQFLPVRLNSKLRDIKDYTITLNTLLRKSAEHVGIHPVHIDNLSNQNIKKIEEAATIEQCFQMWRDLIRSYCRLIHKYNFSDYSPLTQSAMIYIHTEPTADLSLKSLASLLSVNASYLSSVFKKDVGMPLTEYVINTRIRQAQQLLTETKLPIKTIAAQCGIPDIYYFGRLFKRITGTTPKAYRLSKTPLSFSSGEVFGHDEGFGHNEG